MRKGEIVVRITDITVQAFKFRTKIVQDAYGHSHPGVEHERINTIVRIVTDDGVDGYAFGGNPKTIEHILKPALVGEDPLNRELLWTRLRDRMRIYRDIRILDVAAIDLALWDLAGRMFEQPVYKLIGGYRDRVKAYASTMCGDDLPGGLNTPEAYAEFALECKNRGYKAFKMHLWVPPYPGSPDWKHDLEACRAVREAVGDEMVLMVDLCGTYSRLDALLLGKELERLGYYWLEEPIAESSISSYKWLSDNLSIAITGPETTPDIETRAEWIVSGAADILRCGYQDVGGITPLLKVVHLCQCFRVPLEIHMTGLGNLHVLGTMSEPGEYYERGLLHPFIDYSVPPAWLHTIVDPMDSEGYVHLPKEPGLGWSIDFEYINANRI